MIEKDDKKNLQIDQNEEKEKEFADTRKHPRFNIAIKVSYMIISDFTSTPYMYGTTKTLNISEGGMCILIDDKIKVPLMIQLNIQVPQIKYPLSILGKIVWCREDANGKYIIGIKFIGLLPTDWEKILESTAQSTPEKP